jgi:hypothetical protein
MGAESKRGDAGNKAGWAWRCVYRSVVFFSSFLFTSHFWDVFLITSARLGSSE